jgi:hypothetical protein
MHGQQWPVQPVKCCVDATINAAEHHLVHHAGQTLATFGSLIWQLSCDLLIHTIVDSYQVSTLQSCSLGEVQDH